MENRVIPQAPLFRDPIYDGAADPVIIWNRQEESWWIFYTNRRAAGVNHGVSYMHGSDIGIASSADCGRTWTYRGIAGGLEYEKEEIHTGRRRLSNTRGFTICMCRT